MNRICVFCGSSPGASEQYEAAAVADAALEQGGEVIGVIPKVLVEWEVAHKGLKDLRIVGSMHERKALMEELSDGFIALPGGFGTMDEFCEIVTWLQLGIHQKPCGLLNVNGYYDRFLEFADHAVAEGFIRAELRHKVYESDDPSRLLDLFARHHPGPTGKRPPRKKPKP